LLSVKPKQWCDRAKGFFAGKAHLRGCLFQDHGGDIGGAFRRDGPTPDDLHPFGQGILYMDVDLGDRIFINHRANHCALCIARSHAHGIHLCRKLFGKGVIDARLHQNVIGAHAGLPAVAEL